MSFYLKDGDALWPTAEGTYDVRTKLPTGTYTVGIDPRRGFFLKPISDFSVKGKIYGKTSAQADRIIQTFSERPSSTGALLAGEKGSGKTMLAKLISQRAAEQGISTLVINTAFCGDNFNTFIQSITEPCIIVFDEFEKVFDDKEQDAILTLLDGVFPSKKLFILTVNDKYRVSSHMRNRPGRIFYMIEYKGLDADFIREYCTDNLNNKEHIEQVVRLSLIFNSFNFDMLAALIEEMNRYNETPNQALEMLNAKPFEPSDTKHTVEVFMEGKKVKSVQPSIIRGNPVSHDSIDFWIETDTGSEGDDEDDEEQAIEVTPGDLTAINPEEGTFTYVLNEGKPNTTVIVITRESSKRGNKFTWMDAF